MNKGDIVFSSHDNDATYYILDQSQSGSDPAYNVIEFFSLGRNELAVKKLEIRFSWFEKMGYYIAKGDEIIMNKEQLIKDIFNKNIIDLLK